MPSLGASGSDLGDEVENRENRDWSSLSCKVFVVEAAGAGLCEGDVVAGGGRGVFGFDPPIPKPGTETPAAPSRLSAP